MVVSVLAQSFEYYAQLRKGLYPVFKVLIETQTYEILYILYSFNIHRQKKMCY